MVRELGDELLEASKRELNEVPSRREADLQHLRDWLAKQPHIHLGRDSLMAQDQTLMAFLRGCKFSLERAKEKIDMYCTMRTALPEFFAKRDLGDPSMRELLELGTFIPLPEVDDLGRRVFLLRVGKTDPSKIKMEDSFKMNFMAMDVIIREDDHAMVHGTVTLIDLEGVTLGHATQLTPSFVKKAMVCSQDGYPLRPKSINYINTPSMFDTVFNLFKGFSKDKLKKRLHVHGSDFESLYKVIPQRLLPTEYGGQAGSIKELNDAWLARFDEYRERFLSDVCEVDESKRPGGRPKTMQDLFGLEGSFRQLSVD